MACEGRGAAGGYSAALHPEKACPLLGIRSTDATYYPAHLLSFKFIWAPDTHRRGDPGLNELNKKAIFIQFPLQAPAILHRNVLQRHL